MRRTRARVVGGDASVDPGNRKLARHNVFDTYLLTRIRRQKKRLAKYPLINRKVSVKYIAFYNDSEAVDILAHICLTASEKNSLAAVT